MGAIVRESRVAKRSIVIPNIGLYDVAIAAVFVIILAVAAVPRFDADFWWHLYTGGHILKFGVPGRDFLSFTAHNHVWIDHEWLSEVGIYTGLHLGGFALVMTLFGLAIAGAFLASFTVMKWRDVHPSLAVLLTLIAAAATVGTWGPRVQMLSLLMAGVFLILLERHRATGGTRWLVALALLMVLWSNLHGGFAVGLMLIGIYVIGGIFDRARAGMTWRQALRLQRPLLLALLASIGATFLTPGTYHTALYPLRFVTPNVFTNTILESRSPNFHLFQSLPFELLLLGVIVGAFLSRRRLAWTDILVTVVFTHLALQQARNVDLWVVLVVPIAAPYLQEALAPVAGRLSQMNRSAGRHLPSAFGWVLLVGMCIAGASFIGRIDSPKPVLAAVRSDFPTGAINYVRAHHPPGRVFNSYSYGGFLIWATNGKLPVFIDSRADTVYSDSLLRDYLAIYNATPTWQQELQRYRIRWVLVERTAPIASVLRQNKSWKVIFASRQASIFERR